jgi:aspartate/methionine/tyrosine aminotransferase
MVLPEATKKEVLKVHDATIICAPRISQVAALAALTAEPAHIAEFEQILAQRRSLICARLDRVPHIFQYLKPEGAYYVFPRILAEHDDSFEFCTRLLEAAKVALTPGHAFGPTGEHHVRMAYCVSEETIEQAFDRIELNFSS